MDELLENIFVAHAVAAAGSVVIGTSAIHPIDTLLVLKQVGSTPSKQLTVAQLLHRVRTISGYSGLYRGLAWSTTGKMFGIGARFSIYEMLTAFNKDGRDHSYVNVSEALLAGIAAGLVESIVSSPFEIIKLRAQVASASRVAEKRAVNSRSMPRYYSIDMRALRNSADLLSTLTNKHENLLNALKQYPWMMTGSGRAPPVSNLQKPSEIIAFEGWSALWRGLRSGIVRDSIFGGVFFSTWQVLHSATINWKAVQMNPIPRYDDEVSPISPLSISIAAGISGSLAGAASHCFDTAKCRSQCTVIPKFVSKERNLLKWGKPGKTFERLTGIHPADRNLLLNGLWLRTARCGVASFVLVRSYYFFIQSFT